MAKEKVIFEGKMQDYHPFKEEAEAAERVCDAMYKYFELVEKIKDPTGVDSMACTIMELCLYPGVKELNLERMMKIRGMWEACKEYVRNDRKGEENGSTESEGLRTDSDPGRDKT